ncbi:hypothetical protein AGABI1DRAFT_96597 [Agaricus bisporus var. burnettii JB137-S8]|uniref:Fibronectin type-III domain-containing protein n=1 Tax=Agaricus bisporus var. burnettii (strain JB137-S8 / ATCC MYA-4627 / FGSC 10392) TaxID=597362 RepID=K5X6X9_AGABU|nr:uncharacterized protein AGABI1DRAFT_96597 [Agaricus bisporus var. burnettii JB137-S8]EKM83616.1 hypothetical protein AGABI1DRAFT_96597 [Agaricus bisporus var. burnettii JB137-S8]
MELLRHSFWIQAYLFWHAAALVTAEYIPPLEQSFYFDWNAPGQPYPIPVTAQCEVIHITWGRGTATGPNPTAPYYLQVYTSAFLVPFVISVGNVLQYDWAVPFYPGTLYQICMFDKNGHTGGCQDVYTVIPSNGSPSCANVTFPSPLDVEATVENGPLSQFGWIEQCTDIALMPQNGKPPYTMTIAPSLHPPFNITGDGTKPLNWTVSLSWASSFFVSVVDSAGSVWSNGLLHSAAGRSNACLAGVSVSPRRKDVVGIAIGAGFGGLGVGLVVGLLGTLGFSRRRSKKTGSTGSQLALRGSRPHTPQGFATDSLHHTTHSANNRVANARSGSEYYIEPFVMPPRSATSSTQADPVGTSASTPLLAPESTTQADEHGRMRSKVYVVHHDNGRAPVTVYAQEGTSVVELPPGYPGDATEPSRSLHSSGYDALDEGSASSARARSENITGRTEVSGQTEPSVLQRSRRPGQIFKP